MTDKSWRIATNVSWWLMGMGLLIGTVGQVVWINHHWAMAFIGWIVAVIGIPFVAHSIVRALLHH